MNSRGRRWGRGRTAVGARTDGAGKLDGDDLVNDVILRLTTRSISSLDR